MKLRHLLLIVLLAPSTGGPLAQTPSSGRAVDPALYRDLGYRLVGPFRAGRTVGAVGIPTQMAVDETRDLLEACDRLGIAVPALFLNLVTPPGDCRLCSALERRESLAVRDFRQLFRNKQVTLVYRQGELSGLDRLEELGRNLYRPASREEAVVYAS